MVIQLRVRAWSHCHRGQCCCFDGEVKSLVANDCCIMILLSLFILVVMISYIRWPSFFSLLLFLSFFTLSGLLSSLFSSFYPLFVYFWLSLSFSCNTDQMFKMDRTLSILLPPCFLFLCNLLMDYFIVMHFDYIHISIGLK